MHRCVVCPNTSSKASKNFNPNVTFHTFPKNEQRRNRWIQTLKLTRYSHWQRVCSDHFERSDFKPGYKHLLWHYATPTLPMKKITVLTDSESSSSYTENKLNELTQNNQEVEQSNESSEDSCRNVARNDSGTPPRRSSRKIKPVKAPDGVIYQNESPDKKNQSENKSPTLINCNTPLQDLNMSDSKSPKGESRCSVINCKNNNINSKLSFFLYPKDEELKKIWIENCRSESNIYSNGVYRVNSKVCGYHFKEDSFINPSKRNRLKKQAIPTLFVGYVVSRTRPVCNKKEYEKSDTNNFGTKEFDSLSIVIEPPHIQLNEEIHNKIKLLNVQVASKNIHLYCCIPRCINSIEGEDKNVTVSLFRPEKEVVNDWSLVFGLNLTENSVLCERHFKDEDFKSHTISTETGELKIKTLIKGAMPIIIKPKERTSRTRRSNANEGALKRLRSATNEELSVKKHKTHSIDESIAIAENVSPKKNEETPDIGPINGISDQTLKQNEPTDLHPTTSTDVHPTTSTDVHPATSTDVHPTTSTDVHPKTSTDVQPTTSTEDCTSNSSHSSFEQVLPKILANSSLSITLQSNIKQNKNVSTTDSTKVIDDSANSKPTIKLNTDPATTTLDSGPESNSSQPRIGQLLSKTQGNSLSITLEHNTKHTKQISEINSNKVIDSTLTLDSISAIKTEPNDENIIPTTSTNDFIPEYTVPIIEPVSSNISQINSLTLELERQTNKRMNTQVSEIDVTKEVSPIDIIKIEPRDDDDDDDEDLIPITSTDDCASDSSQLIPSQVSSNVSFNKSVSLTSIKQIKQKSPVKVSKIVSPTIISKPITKLNTEPTNILPDNNMVNTLKSNLDQILSKKSINSVSDKLKPSLNHSHPSTSANNCITNTIQPNIKQSELKSAATYKVSNKLSTNSKMYPNFDNNQLLETITINVDQMNQNNGSPIILDCISLDSSEDSLNYDNILSAELNYGTNSTRSEETGTSPEDFMHMDVGFIRDISKKAALPNNFWKNLYSMSQNTTIFIQQDEFLVPIKKIYFQNSLTPEIHINGKRYNYEIAVTSQLELENLLEKINNIEVCLGYDGLFHENCIGYFEDTSDEEIEVCCNCRKLIKGTERLTIYNKLQNIEFSKNKLSKMEYRVMKARKQMQQNKKREEISEIMKAISPMNFFNVLKHPNY